MRRFCHGLLVLFVSAAAACTTPVDDGSEAPARAWEVEALPFAVGADQPLRMAMVRPPSFRPDEVGLVDQGAVIVADLLYDGLTEVDGSTGGLRPGLASTWVADPTFRRWTFELDRASGVSADTVVASLAALVTDPVDGTPPPMTAAALTAGFDAVRAADERTVVIELDRPNAGLPWVLSGLPYSVVGDDGAATGAYEVLEDDSASLVLRPRDALGAADRSGQVRVRWVDEPVTAYRLLVDRSVDAAVVGPESLPDAERRFGWTPSPTVGSRYYVLNAGAPALRDRASRSQVIDAVDAVDLVRSTGRADLVALHDLVPPAASGWRPGEPTDGATSPAGGSSTTFVPLRLASVGRGPAPLTSALEAHLAAAGHDVEHSSLQAADLASAIVDGSTDVFAFGWVAPAGSVDAILPPLLGPGSPANVARIADPAVGELLDRAAVTADDDARWDLLDRAHRLALDEGTLLPVAATGSTLVAASAESELVVRADGSLDLESSR